MNTLIYIADNASVIRNVIPLFSKNEGLQIEYFEDGNLLAFRCEDNIHVKLIEHINALLVKPKAVNPPILKQQALLTYGNATVCMYKLAAGNQDITFTSTQFNLLSFMLDNMLDNRPLHTDSRLQQNGEAIS